MAYQTYITEALVCGNQNRNTSDKSYYLFTRDAGMVTGTARSVRRENSKQRFALQDFSHIRASLVSGKAGWRIAGVESFGNVYFNSPSREKRTYVRNVLKLLRRVIHGESPHPELFDEVIHALTSGPTSHLDQLELITTLRLLHLLGYIHPDKAYASLLVSDLDYSKVLPLVTEKIRRCKEAVEHALLNSQL